MIVGKKIRFLDNRSIFDVLLNFALFPAGKNRSWSLARRARPPCSLISGGIPSTSVAFVSGPSRSHVELVSRPVLFGLDVAGYNQLPKLDRHD